MNEQDQRNLFLFLSDLFSFADTAFNSIKERGILSNFECPLCHGQAHAIIDNDSGHFRCYCENCSASITQ